MYSVGKEVPRWGYFDAPALIAGETKYPCERCQRPANKKDIDGLTKQILLETCNESDADPNEPQMPDERWETSCDGVLLTLGLQKTEKNTTYRARTTPHPHRIVTGLGTTALYLRCALALADLHTLKH